MSLCSDVNYVTEADAPEAPMFIYCVIMMSLLKRDV